MHIPPFMLFVGILSSITYANSHKKESPLKKDRAPLAKKYIIQNDIQHDHLGHYKFLKKHFPQSFTLYVNGEKVETNQKITLSEPKVVISYEYSWKTPWGKKEGKKSTHFELHPSSQPHTISFAGWNEKQRIMVTSAKRTADEISQ